MKHDASRSLCILPPEIISHTLYFVTSARDIIRLRRVRMFSFDCSSVPRAATVLGLIATNWQVSKQFKDLTYDLEIWRTLYANSRLPRPPGPFSSQSAQFLERALIKSERLAHSWTTQPMEDILNVRMQFPGPHTPTRRIMYGKWLVGCESSSMFVVYDLDSDTVPCRRQVLWESASPITSWDACSAVSTSGLLIHIAFNIVHELPVSWKLLEFRLNGDTLEHTFTVDVPTRRSEGEVYLRGGHSPFSYIVNDGLLFDAETRLFYEFPDFTSALTERYNGESWCRIPHTIRFSKTHVIVAILYPDATPRSYSTLIQAFTAPADPRPLHNGTGVFALSHERIAPGIGGITSGDPIRNSIVDVATGATNIRLLHHVHQIDALHLYCLDLTLHQHSSMDIALPMTIDIHDIAQVHYPYSLDRYIEVSDDGHTRGLFLLSGSKDNCVMRFTIDASQDRCVGVVGQISSIQSMPNRTPVARWTEAVNFEGLGGRLFFTGHWSPPNDYHDTVLINTK